MACFDLDGNREWTTVVNVTEQRAQLRGLPVPGRRPARHQVARTTWLVALDGKTGRVVTPMPVWKTEGLNAYSTALPLLIGGERVVVQAFGVITRLRDGRTLSQTFTPPYYNIADYVSPTVEGRTLCSFILAKNESGIRLAFQTLPDQFADPLVMKGTRQCEFNVKKFPCWFNYNHNASPLLYEGLAYVMSVEGVLTVIDAAKGEVVYHKLMDFNPLMMHGGRPDLPHRLLGQPHARRPHIYLWDDQGPAGHRTGTDLQAAGPQPHRPDPLLLRTARNECMIGNPVFSGKRMYVRAENHLYCIAEEARR